MPRIRTIKPEFWTDGAMLKISRDARLFYIGLWNFADDNGVLEDNPLELKARIFPLDEIKIDELLAELKTIGKVIEYEVNARKYLWVKNFVIHQVIDRPRKHTLPLPTNHPDFNRIQTISTEISPGREGKGKEGKGIDAFTPAFEKVWERFPNKVGKPDAFRHFKASVKTEQDLVNINKALDNYVKSERVKKGYVQNGSTWFHDWQGWLTPPTHEMPKQGIERFRINNAK